MTNRPLARIAGLLAAAALLGGCAATDGDAADNAPPTTVAVSVPPVATQTADPEEPEGSEPATTIADYLAENGIGWTPLLAATETGPVAEFDLPDGWSLADPEHFPQAHTVAIGERWESTDDAGPPPTAILTMLRLDRLVDAEELLQHAGGAVENLPDFEVALDDPDSEVSGYPSYALSGEYLDAEAGYMAIVERTVVADDGEATYVIQLRITTQSQHAEPVTDSVQEIDRSLTVTPRPAE